MNATPVGASYFASYPPARQPAWTELTASYRWAPQAWLGDSSACITGDLHNMFNRSLTPAGIKQFVLNKAHAARHPSSCGLRGIRIDSLS